MFVKLVLGLVLGEVCFLESSVVFFKYGVNFNFDLVEIYIYILDGWYYGFVEVLDLSMKGFWI